jgi:Dynein light intermediate chain (DLIC)
VVLTQSVLPLVLKQFLEYAEPDEGLSTTVLSTPSLSRRPPNQTVSTNDSDAQMSSLGDNTLSCNLGIPIIVVLTKVFSIKQFILMPLKTIAFVSVLTLTLSEFFCFQFGLN